MALAIISVGTIISVLAHDNSAKLSNMGWIDYASAVMRQINYSSKSAALVHDDDHYQTSGTFNNTLSNAVVSQHQGGDTIVVMTAKGALPGTLTLKLQRDVTGTAIIGGEWAFNVSYTEVRHVVPKTPDGEDHSEFLVQRGSLKGTITDGHVTIGTDGAITNIDSVQLAINGGSLSFHRTNSGSGSGQVTNLRDAGISTGSLNLTF